MANNPKKVKDPTEVALSAIQEALNIGDTAEVDSARNSLRGTIASSGSASAPAFSASAFDARPSTDRATFEPASSRARRTAPRTTTAKPSERFCRPSKRAGRRATSICSLRFSRAVWLLGATLMTVSFLPSLQAAIGQGGGALVLAGLAASFFAPVLLFYFLASLSWRGQELRMIAQSMAQVAIRFSEPEGATSDSMVTVGQAIRREVAAMGDGVETRHRARRRTRNTRRQRSRRP